MRTLGIDLAAQDADTAVCEIEWSEAGAAVLVPEVGVGDERLAELIRASDWTAIDAPFGWPSPFAEAIRAHAKGRRWPEVSSKALRHRETDRRATELVRERTGLGLHPLSVSSDRIAVCAWRCAALLSTIGGKGTRPRLSGADRVVEAYPAAALALWGLAHRGYKGRAGAGAARKVTVERIARRTRGSIGFGRGAKAAMVASDHALDAFVCACVARAAAVGGTTWPRKRELEAAATEGWIHLPSEVALEELTGADPAKPPKRVRAA